MTSRVFNEDINYVVSSANISWDQLAGSTVLVTGATGLVGGALVRTLSAAEKTYSLDMRIFAHGRNADVGKILSYESNVEFIEGDIREPLSELIAKSKVDFIFHCAAITKSTVMVAKPVEVMTTAVDGTRKILDLAREKRTKSVVFLSSMEVYGQCLIGEVKELDLGYLDLRNPRSSYPESKRFCESLCACYYAQYGVPVKIARLAQTFGAGSPKDDTRVFAQFARSAIEDENIVLHTQGHSQGNYCYLADAVRALFTLLLKGENGEIYNVANPAASVTIREMAEIVADTVGQGRISVVVHVPEDIEKRGYAPDMTTKLNADKMIELGWRPEFGLAEMYERMIEDWKEHNV